MQNVHLHEVESTNRYCETLDFSTVSTPICYWTTCQTAGIGQQGNHWECANTRDIACSIILKPTFLSVARQYEITIMLSLALCDTLKKMLQREVIDIKWPNDIYVDGGKICGILASIHTSNNHITSAICGIGLNVNHLFFSPDIPHPTSMAILTWQQYNIEEVLAELLSCVEARYERLQQGEQMLQEYYSHLLNFGVKAHYVVGTKEIVARIEGVDEWGRLLLVDECGVHYCCNIKEISLLYPYQRAVK